MALNESPAFLLLDTDVSHQHKELPLALYESGEHFLRSTDIFLFKGDQLCCQLRERIKAVHGLAIDTVESVILYERASPAAEIHSIEGIQQSVFVAADYTIQVIACKANKDVTLPVQNLT